MALSLILHDIRSAYNVGALLRTADGAGAAHVYLTGYTPVPHDGTRAWTLPAERQIAKTALGAEASVPWTAAGDIGLLLARLRADGVQIVALEQSPHSVDYRAFVPSAAAVALVVGNEPEGISQDVLAQVDAVVDIPMRGAKNSLNVAVAAGIAAYALTADRHDGRVV